MPSKILLELFRAIGASHNNGRFSLNKLIIILAQLRHMRAAERSGKAAIEDEDDVLLALIIAQRYGLPIKIVQCEIGRN